MSMIDDALAGLAKGAAVGSVVPGIGTAIGGAAGGLIGVALNLMPGAAHLLGGSEGVAAKAAAAVQAVTGQADPAAAQAAVDADAGLAGDLRVQLAQIASDARSAQLADVADARQQTITLAKSGSAIAWASPVVSVIVMLSFGGLCALLLFRTVPDQSINLLYILLGSLSSMATTTVSYWLGSSAGSADKSDKLANSVPASLLTTQVNR